LLLLRGFSALALLSVLPASLPGFEALLDALSALDVALVASVSPDDAASFPVFVLEPDEVPSVTVLEGVSFSTETGLEEVSSQLAQKNPVKARTIFFQCL
jgi:hypothetical protein